MSADDGYYILATKGEDGQTEFRTVWAQGMDWEFVTPEDPSELDDYTQPPLTRDFVVKFFELYRKSPIIYDEDQAWREAQDMNDIAYETELGVNMLDYREVPYPTE